jgi:hypothetical protein
MQEKIDWKQVIKHFKSRRGLSEGLLFDRHYYAPNPATVRAMASQHSQKLKFQISVNCRGERYYYLFRIPKRKQMPALMVEDN